MIVRILSEGQYRLDSAYLDQLNELDNRLVDTVAKGSEAEFAALFGDMLNLVRQKGGRVGNEELVASDVVLPDPSMRMDEVRHLFQGNGIVPG